MSAKESSCGCAGCFTGHAAIELYAEAFDSVGRLERLADFSSKFGCEYIGSTEGGREYIGREGVWVLIKV